MNIDKSLKVLHFKVDDINLCLNINEIVKVIDLVWLDSVPANKNYIVGLVNFFDRSVPVIDLVQRLGIQRNRNFKLDNPIIILEQHNECFGILVDKIFKIAEIEKNDINFGKLFKNDLIFSGAIAISKSKQAFLLNTEYLVLER